MQPEPILQASPGANYHAHQAEIDAAVQTALASGWYILGQQVADFEREFADYLGVAEVVGVANGTDAIVLALRALNVGPGDLVFTVSHTAVATVTAVELTGATPVLVDIDPLTYTLSANHLADLLADLPVAGRPAVVLPVHIYGHPADLTALQALADAHGMTLVEDCAQSHGSRYHGQMTGSIGRLATFSFYPTKNLGALGDGGAVATNDPALAERLRGLRQYGWQSTRYVSDYPGYNSRLDELQAAILRVKLRHLEADNIKRQALADQYRAGLAATPLVLPTTDPNCTHVYHQYVVRTSQRNELMAALKAQGIGTAIHYPVPVHLQPAYAQRLVATPLLNTEQAAHEIVSLPMYPELSPQAVARVIAALTAFHR